METEMRQIIDKELGITFTSEDINKPAQCDRCGRTLQHRIFKNIYTGEQFYGDCETPFDWVTENELEWDEDTGLGLIHTECEYWGRQSVIDVDKAGNVLGGCCTECGNEW